MKQLANYFIPFLITFCVISLYLSTELLNYDASVNFRANAADVLLSPWEGYIPLSPPYNGYIPAPVESYVVEHAKELNYHDPRDPSGCNIWSSSTATPYHKELHQFLGELRDYSNRVRMFTPIKQDLRVLIQNKSQEEVCKSLELHPDGIPGMFPSGQLSWTRVGFSEPLLTPMRHPEFCFDTEYTMNMNYMIHDFAEMCRQLKPSSRTVFIDMGASLDFHETESPAMYIIELYTKFGFVFDHIYAFEIRKKDPAAVFQKVPAHLMASYHWNNVAVSPEPNNKFNPLDSILSRYSRDDLVVVKLDVDTSSVEVPLADQIVENPALSEIIDQFYFEHHVHMRESARNWKKSMKGTIEDTLKRFRKLRQLGVAAHFWP